MKAKYYFWHKGTREARDWNENSHREVPRSRATECVMNVKKEINAPFQAPFATV